MAASAQPLTSGQRFSLATVKVSDIGWVLVFNLALFAAPIQNTFGFSYIDELVTLLAVFLYAKRRLAAGSTMRIPTYGARCLICLAVVVCLGLVGNLLSGLGTSPVAIAIDFFACVKTPLALVCFIASMEDKSRLFGFIEGECKVFAAVLLIIGLLNLVIPMAPFYGEVRYGIRSLIFVFGHPEVLVFICVGMTVVLCANAQRNRLWIIALAVVSCLSLRTKGMVFAAIAVFLIYTWGHEGRFKMWHVLVGAGVAVLIGWDQYQAYYQSAGIARGELAKAAMQVANTYFPTGSGFASFGSNVTANLAYYSPLYYLYGLNTIYGLAPNAAGFLSDTFWPIVIGQFGWFGLVFYCLSILFLFLFAYRSAKNGNTRLAVVVCFLFLLISSTAESAFFNPHALFLVICMAFTVASTGNFRNGHEDD